MLRELLELERAREDRRRRRARMMLWAAPALVLLVVVGLVWSNAQREAADDRCVTDQALAAMMGEEIPDCR